LRFCVCGIERSGSTGTGIPTSYPLQLTWGSERGDDKKCWQREGKVAKCLLITHHSITDGVNCRGSLNVYLGYSCVLFGTYRYYQLQVLPVASRFRRAFSESRVSLTFFRFLPFGLPLLVLPLVLLAPFICLLFRKNPLLVAVEEKRFVFLLQLTVSPS